RSTACLPDAAPVMRSGRAWAATSSGIPATSRSTSERSWQRAVGSGQSACCPPTAYRLPPTAYCLLSPDLSIDVLVAVLRLVDIVRSAVAIEVGRGEEMRRRDEAARRLTRERAIQFVDADPSL